MIQDQGDLLPPETILTIHHIMLSFTDRQNLSPEQLTSIKSAGLPFRGAGKETAGEEISFYKFKDFIMFWIRHFSLVYDLWLSTRSNVAHYS